jgi:hypothetical protein
MKQPQLLKMPPAYYAQRIQVNAAQADAMMMDELHLIVQKLQAYAAQAAAAPSTSVTFISNRVQVVCIYAHTMAVHINNKIKH